MKFGNALTALENGHMVAREGWNGKGMFVYKTVGNTVPKDFIPKFASLPPAVKTFLASKDQDVVFQSSLTMYCADGTMQPGWLASQRDMLADDWEVVEPVAVKSEAGKFRKKPVVIDAIQFEGTWNSLADITGRFHEMEQDGMLLEDDKMTVPYFGIKTLEGTMKCQTGDYVIKGVKGEFYPCKPDIFEATYDKA